jgi:NADH dehydrogenase
VWGIRHEAAKPGSYFWLKGGNRPQQLRVDKQTTLR